MVYGALSCPGANGVRKEIAIGCLLMPLVIGIDKISNGVPYTIMSIGL